MICLLTEGIHDVYMLINKKSLYVRIFVLLIVMIVMRKLFFEIKTMSPPIKYLPYNIRSALFIILSLCVLSCFRICFTYNIAIMCLSYYVV